jgi:nucleoside-diphosphate-sugar epimerase
MRVAIIGGTGHIGSYLTPRLFDAGQTVLRINTPDGYNTDAILCLRQLLRITNMFAI